MRNVNLIPAARQRARRRRQQIKWCAAVCVAYGVVSVVAGAAVVLAFGGRDPSVARELAAVEQDIQKTDQSLAQAQADLTRARTVLAATRQMCDRPDWSQLPALLAQAGRDRVMLRTCELSPAGAGEAGVPGGPFTLVASGVARTPADAQAYAIRLQQTGLFDRVTLADTHREPFAGLDASAFRIECTLSAAPPAPSGKDNPS